MVDGGLMVLSGAPLLDWARQYVELKLQLSAARHSGGCAVRLGVTPVEEIAGVCSCRERYDLWDLTGRQELLGRVVDELRGAGRDDLVDAVVTAVARPLQYEAVVRSMVDGPLFDPKVTGR